MIAVKANKEYRIDEQDKEKYLADGWDILGDDFEVIEKASNDNSEKIAELEEKIAELEEEIVELKKENATLKGQITKLKNGK